MLKNYLKVALKVLARRKVFTAISLFGISFTLLVLVVAAAMFDHAFAPTPPELHTDRLLMLTRVTLHGPDVTANASAGYRLLDRYARGLQGVEQFGIGSFTHSVNAYTGGARVTLALNRTDAGYWRVLQFTFLEGAPYTADDVRQARFVAVINAATRERFFGAAPALGKTIEADGQRFRVIGVVPDLSPWRIISAADMYVPLTTSKTDAYTRENLGSFIGLILAKTPQDVPLIRHEFNDRLRAFDFEGVANRRLFEGIVAPFETMTDAFARQSPLNDRRDNSPQGWKVRVLLAAVTLLFMLLPTVNLINLNMSRIMERSSEIGVRKAFGASSRTLVGQFIVENLLLTILGGLIAFVLSFFVLRLLSSSGLAGRATFTLNPRVFLYGLGLAVVFGLLSGVYPAWRMSRLHPVQALKGTPR